MLELTKSSVKTLSLNRKPISKIVLNINKQIKYNKTNAIAISVEK
jgi:hypothetical protein